MNNRDKFLFALPATIGGVFAVGLLATLVWPQWQDVRVGRQRIDELRALSAQLPMLGQQLQSEQREIVRAQARQGSVLQAMASGGGLTTFMAQVDKLAALSGVKLALFEPAPGAPGPPGNAPSPSNSPAARKPSPPADPLLGPGMAKQEALLSASGSYPAILKFIRQLEMLSVLVVQSDLHLSLPEANEPSKSPSPDLKLRVATYFRAPS